MVLLKTKKEHLPYWKQRSVSKNQTGFHGGEQKLMPYYLCVAKVLGKKKVTAEINKRTTMKSKLN